MHTGCFCEEGTVLLEEDGEVCVAPDDCPAKETQECPEGMVYQECGTACPTTCDSKDEEVIPCTLQCVQGKSVIYTSKRKKGKIIKQGSTAMNDIVCLLTQVVSVMAAQFC